MREIRFRTWDKVRREYLSGGRVLISVEPGKRPKNNPVYLDILTDPDFYKDRFVLEQFTGLKDKNGKDIYEGDIFITRGLCMAVVEWEKEGRFLGFTIGGDRKIMYINREPKVEVIGNIHDNPDLLGNPHA